MKPSSFLLLSMTLLLSACTSSGQPRQTHQDVAVYSDAQGLPADAVVYDSLASGGVVKAIGQNVRVGSPSTKVVLSAQLSSGTPLTVDAAVFGVRRNSTENRDVGWVGNYTIGSALQTFTASGTFPVGNYTFWFAYLKNGQWVEGNKRAFTITDSGTVSVPLDPVSSNENAGMLKLIGSDTKKGLANAPTQFAAQLSSATPLNVDQLIFAVRDASGNNFDTRVTGNPSSIGNSTSVRGWRTFPAGTYTYWLAYRQGTQWVNLGEPRSFLIEEPPAAPVPPNTSWELNPNLSDEFDGNSINSSKWQTNFGEIAYPISTYKDTAGNTRPLLAFKDTNVTVNNGSLNLTATKENYKNAPYTAGAVQSQFDIPGQPSYVEVRAKMLNSQANVLSAIWLQTFPTTINPNPEIDIQETFDYSKLVSTLHVWPNSNSTEHDQFASNSFHTGVADVSQDYHVYGLERRDGWLRFYFDGKLAWQVKPYYPETASMPRRLVFSLEAHLANSNKFPVDALLPGSAFQVDYVRTYTFKEP